MADGQVCRPSSSSFQAKPISSYAAILVGEKELEFSNVQASTSDAKSISQAATSAPIDCSVVEFAELKQPELLQGTPAIFYNLAEQSSLAKKFQYALVGKFSQGKPSWKKVMEFFERIKLSSPYKVSIFDHKHLYIVCSNKSDFNRLWLRLVWFIDGYAMRIFKWETTFSAKKESSIAPVWIRMEGLPLYMFDKMPLLNISNVIGKPICIDRRNLNGTMCNTAKVCIELDVSKPLVEYIKLGIVQNDSRTIVEEHLVHVFYDVVPPFCKLCQHLGHSQEMCKRSNSSIVEADSSDHRPGKEMAATQQVQQKNIQVWQQVRRRRKEGAAAIPVNHNEGILAIAAEGKSSQVAVSEGLATHHEVEGELLVLDVPASNEAIAVCAGQVATAAKAVAPTKPDTALTALDQTGTTLDHHNSINVSNSTMMGAVVDLENGWTTVKRKKKKSVSPAIAQIPNAHEEKAVHTQQNELQTLQFQQHLPSSLTNSRLEELIAQMYTNRVDAAIEYAIDEDILESFATPPTSRQSLQSPTVAAPSSDWTEAGKIRGIAAMTAESEGSLLESHQLAHSKGKNEDPGHTLQPCLNQHRGNEATWAEEVEANKEDISTQKTTGTDARAEVMNVAEITKSSIGSILSEKLNKFRNLKYCDELDKGIRNKLRRSSSVPPNQIVMTKVLEENKDNTDLPIDFDQIFIDHEEKEYSWEDIRSKHLVASYRSVSPHGRSSRKFSSLRKKIEMLYYLEGKAGLWDKASYEETRIKRTNWSSRPDPNTPTNKEKHAQSAPQASRRERGRNRGHHNRKHGKGPF